MHDHEHVSEQQRTRPQESPRAAQHPHSTQMEREQHRHDPFMAGTHAPAGGPHAPEHHAHMVADFRRRFWVSLVLTVPIIVLSPMLQDWFGLGTALRFPGDTWVQLVFSTAVFFYGGWPFLTGLFSELHERQPGMMTLISMAISVVYVYSAAVVFGLRGVPFFWELATLIDIMLLGHWIEMRSVMGASAALESLVRLMPSEAHRLRPDGSTEDVPISALQPGDRVLIKPGEKVPTDGMIVAGRTSLNEAMLTGESRPVEKGEGDQAIGGSVNGESAITVEVQKTGDQTYLAQVIDLVRKAQESRSRTQDLANRAAFWLTVTALSVGFGTLAFWLIFGETVNFAITRAVTVMVIACPHALGLAVPLVVAISTALSASNGLLIRDRSAFVRMSDGIVALNSTIELMRDLGRPREDLWEVALWEDVLAVQGNEAFYTYQVNNESIAIPENIDAIRALAGTVKDGPTSIRMTDEALGIQHDFFPAQ